MGCRSVAHDEKARESQAGAAERAAEVVRLAPARARCRPGSYVVATPIGNLARHHPARAGRAGAGRRDLLRGHAPQPHAARPFRSRGRTRPYHEHNAERERPRVLAELAAGKSVALISDAGTPLISDPGYKLVREAIAAGYPGDQPCPAHRRRWRRSSRRAWRPTRSCSPASCRRDSGARQARLAELKAVPATLVFFEAPSRLAESLGDIAAVLGDREAAVARELTKLHEEVRRGTPAELAEWAAEASAQGRDGDPRRPAARAAGDGRGDRGPARAAARRDEPQRSGRTVAGTLGVPRGAPTMSASALKKPAGN